MRPIVAAALALALALAGCTGVEGAVARVEFRENVVSLFRGRDRGYDHYRNTIERVTVRARGASHYQYVAPAHISHYLIQRSVRGLGGTRINSSRRLAGAADRILLVAARDPTPGTRGLACLQLGRLLLRLGAPLDQPIPRQPEADPKIHSVAADLLTFHRTMAKGGKVKTRLVVDLLKSLDALRPTNFIGAREAVRILASSPVATTSRKEVRSEAERIARPLVRDCVLVALSEIACGDPDNQDFPPDPSPIVRANAADVLARIAHPVAYAAAIQRLLDPIDPAERNADVRRNLVRYLGAVGGEQAFEVCLRRIDDVDSGVRFHGHQALHRMTGAVVEPTAAAWAQWRAAHPEGLSPGSDPAGAPR